MKVIFLWVRNTFGFSKTESNGFVILLPLMVLIIFIPIILRQYYVNDPNGTFQAHRADSIMHILSERRIEQKQKYYQKKNWTYNKQESSQKNSDQKYKKKENEPKWKTDQPAKKSTEIKTEKKLIAFDLNTADTVQLKAIYGVGSVLSNRIVKYRDLLGGYVNKKQLDDVYGLEGEALELLKSNCYITDNYIPKQLAINQLKSYQLDDHPYISKKVAQAIDNYRFQHGAIKNVNTLFKLHLMDSATVQKISPYLKY